MCAERNSNTVFLRIKDKRASMSKRDQFEFFISAFCAETHQICCEKKMNPGFDSAAQEDLSKAPTDYGNFIDLT